MNSHVKRSRAERTSWSDSGANDRDTAWRVPLPGIWGVCGSGVAGLVAAERCTQICVRETTVIASRPPDCLAVLCGPTQRLR